MFDRRRLFQGPLDQAAGGAPMAPRPVANWLTGMQQAAAQPMPAPAAPMAPAAGISDPLTAPAAPSAYGVPVAAPAVMPQYAPPYLYQPSAAPPPPPMQRRPPMTAPGGGPPISPALASAVATQQQGAAPTPVTTVPGVSPPPVVDPTVAPPPSPSGIPAAVGPQFQAQAASPYAAATRPRADGAPGPAPADWQQSGGYFYPTSIASWLGRYQQQLAAATQPAPVPAAAPPLPAPATTPPQAAPVVASPPAAASPTLASQMTPEQWTAFSTTPQPNGMVLANSGVTQADYAAYQAAEQAAVDNGTAARAAAQTNAYQNARDYAIGVRPDTNTGFDDAAARATRLDTTAAYQQFVNSGYTPEQALAGGWGTGNGTQGWMTPAAPAVPVAPAGGGSTINPNDTKYLPIQPPAAAPVPKPVVSDPTATKQNLAPGTVATPPSPVVSDPTATKQGLAPLKPLKTFMGSLGLAAGGT